MSAPLTRQDVEREVRRIGLTSARPPYGEYVPVETVTAALLAMAECDGPWHRMTEDNQWHDSDRCGLCSGTGLDQARLARGLAALKGDAT